MSSKPSRHEPPPPGAWTFFRQWLRHPLSIAAISPSSRQLARLMVKELPPNCERVIELGGGTGVFTRALLDHGIADDNLMVVELNEELHHHLSRRFPDVHVALSDARELPAVAKKAGYADAGQVDAVISGLGLLSMSHELQQQILESAFSMLRPGGRFIQFTYGPVCPVAKDVQQALKLRNRRGGFAVWNMPPATVFVLTQARSKAVEARPMGTPRKRRSGSGKSDIQASR